MQFKICDFCGANLDPDEKCECEIEYINHKRLSAMRKRIAAGLRKMEEIKDDIIRY